MNDDFLSSKRVNPMIDRYVTTDYPLRYILETGPMPMPPISRALLYIHECLDGKRLARDAVQAATSVSIKGSDPELVILMLSSWAELSCRISRPQEAKTLIHRANTMITEKTHPEIKARCMQVESILSDMTGNKTRKEELLREIIDMIPSFSPRRKFYVWELALFLAQQGRGVEFDSEVKELSWQTNEQFSPNLVLAVQFVNFIETGRTDDAERILQNMEITPRTLGQLNSVPFKSYEKFMSVMHAAMADGSINASTESLPANISVIVSLLNGKTEEALRTSRKEANKDLSSIFGNGFDSFNLIRAELSAGNAEAAQRLITMRQNRGNTHYLDNLFLARAEMLNRNRSKAVKYFADTLTAVDRFQARERLNFELRIAREISREQIMDLTRSAEQQIQKKTAAKDTEPEITSNAQEDTDAPPVFGVNLIMGQSDSIQNLKQTIMKFGVMDAPVLITGETGTGKELVARAIHSVSKRSSFPFNPVNCGAIAESLLESELFGHEKGAFTGADRTSEGLFEGTGKGTIFLDEIGEISSRLQVALLRVLETGEIRAVGSSKTRSIQCRIIAATNANLDELSDKGIIRKDLLYRLKRLHIEIPPLRERREDIMLLIRHFLDEGRPIGSHARISKESRDLLVDYDWPGNVRELKNVIEQMRLLHSDKLSYDITDLDIKFHSMASRLSSKAGAFKQASPDAEAANRADAQQEPMTHSGISKMLKQGTSPVRRTDQLKALFEKHRKLTRSEVIKILDVSPNTATKYLKSLCDEGVIERIEPSASTRSHYFILIEDE